MELPMKQIDILWTSGWDSTYRVIEAARQGLSIQPHYIVDSGRVSHPIEVTTIAMLTRDIARRWPEARISPPLLTLRSEIAPEPEITASYERLRKVNGLGIQYDLFARYALGNNLDALELGVHQQDKAHRFITEVAKNGDGGWVVQNNGSDAARLFSRFRFPVLELTKLDMEERAYSGGFLDLLDRTWFCFNPIKRQPCGLCNPCTYTIEEGLARRLPAAALRRHAHRNRLDYRIRRRVAGTLRRIADLVS
jgi:hypothetical protein